MADGLEERFPPELLEGYEPLELLGAGGMGAVYRARDRALERDVAIKLIHPGRSESRAERFLREANSLATIRHPNVLEVFSAGSTSRGPYMITELLEGRPLAPDLPGVDPVQVALQVAEGLEEVHRLGLVHRDVKPENIVVDAGGRAVLVDFGLVLDPDRTRLTREDQFLGTVSFMAPEVLAGARGAAPSDWYSLGATLFRVLEGRAPFHNLELLEIIDGRPPAPIRFLTLGESDPRSVLVEALMHPDPAARPRSREELEALLAGPLPRERRAQFGSPVPGGSSMAAVPLDTGPVPRRRGPPPLALVAGALALVLAGWVALRVTGPPPPPPPPPAATTAALPASREPEPEPEFRVRIMGEASPVRGGEGLGAGLLAITGTYPFEHGIGVLSISPGGEVLALPGPPPGVTLWGVGDLELEAVLEPGGGPARSVAFSPAGDWLAVGTQGGDIELHDLARREPTRAWKAHEGAVSVLRWDGTETLLSMGYDHGVATWSARTGELRRRFVGHEGPVLFGAVVDGERVVSTSYDDSSRVWERARGREILRVVGPEGSVLGVTALGEGRELLTGHRDGGLIRRDLRSGDVVRRIPVHGASVSGLAVDRRERHVLTGSWDGTAAWTALGTGEVLARTPEIDGSWVRAVALTPDGDRGILWTADGTLALVEPATGRELARRALEPTLGELVAEVEAARTRVRPLRAIGKHAERVEALVALPGEGKVVSAARDGVLRIHGLAEGEPEAELVALGSGVHALGILPGGKRLVAAGEGGGLRVLAREGGAAKVLPGHGDWVADLAVAPGLALASVGWDGALIVRPLGRGEPRKLAAHPGKALAVAFSDDGRLLVTGGGGGAVTIRDARSLEVRGTLALGEADVGGVALAPGGAEGAAALADGRVLRFDPATARVLGESHAHDDRAVRVAYSPGGSFLASTGWDGVVRVKARETDRPPWTLEGHEGPVGPLRFLDDATLVTGGWDGAVLLWRLPG